MAKTTFSSLSPLIFFFFFFFFFSLVLAEHEHDTFSTTLSPATLKLKKEKLSHLHFYFHDILSGRHPTVMNIAKADATNTSATFFGLLNMADDPLTVGPEPTSRVVGRAQGMYGSASQSEIGFVMVFNFAFVEGKFNGSALSLFGRNSALHAVREMPIVGGSGLFRFARGYAEARTHTIDLKTGDAVVEYNVYVFHY